MKKTVLEFLQELELNENNIFEAIGQILDTMVQVIESRVYELSKELQISNSLGDLQESLYKHGDNSLAEKLSNVRKIRKDIDIKSPEIDLVAKLKDAVIDLIGTTAYKDQKYELRIQYIPKLINSSGIDTNNGFCKFNLYHGSVSHIKCSILLISAISIADGFDGQVYNALKWMYDIQNAQKHCTLDFGKFKIHHYNTDRLNTPFGHLIILSIEDFNEIENEEIDNYFLQSFSFLSYLENQGIDISNIGTSFLFGNSVRNKSIAIELLIQNSLSWLKNVKKNSTIHCSVFYTDLVEFFNQTMNKTLNRNYVDCDKNPILNSIIIEVKTMLHNQKKGVLEEGISPLYSALSVKENINVELICTFARTLCELIVKDIHIKNKIKVSGDLLSSIEKLRSENILSPWICSYMHGLRILGNKSVHPNTQVPLYSPKSLDYNDLLIALTGVKALVEFYNVNISNEIE
jgi:hypothetical protein